jgi:hypothetical protein
LGAPFRTLSVDRIVPIGRSLTSVERTLDELFLAVNAAPSLKTSSLRQTRASSRSRGPPAALRCVRFVTYLLTPRHRHRRSLFASVEKL